MISKKNLLDLYVNRRKSVGEIAKKLKCSENGVNYWISKYGIKKRSISDALYIKNNPNGDPFEEPHDILLDKNFLYGLGMGLFWGEGNKKSKNAVRLGNTDPDLVKKFVLFLDRVFKIDKKKLRFGIQIFKDLDKDEVLNYWKKVLKIKSDQIYKTVVVSESLKGGTYKIKNKYGVITIYFNNTKLKSVFDKHIESIKKID